MADEFVLYTSAAFDLSAERDLISRTVVEIPTSLVWRIYLTPHPGEVPNLEAVAQADAFLLLIGEDIRAPIGTELYTRRQAGKQVHLLLKKTAQRTPAAQVFVREMELYGHWESYEDARDLRKTVFQIITETILDRAAYFQLSDAEYQKLSKWRSEIEENAKSGEALVAGEAGESSVIFSPERFTPSGGVLLENPNSENSD